MARGFSKAIITGNLTRDPEMRSTPNGATVCTFSVAVNRNYRDSSGNAQEAVSFIDCAAWGKGGEIINQYAKKGTGILVSGRLDQRSWEDKGSGQRRSRVEIVVEDFNFLGGGNSGGNGGQGYSGGYEGGGEYTAADAEAAGAMGGAAGGDGGSGDMPDEPIDLSEIPF